VRKALFLLLCLAGAALGAPEGERTLRLDEKFKGKVSLSKRGIVTIFYDFKDPAQFEDWVRFKPFRVHGELDVAEVEGGRIHLKGVGALRHTATFRDEVSLECDLTPTWTKDLGMVVAENAESNQFVLYCLNDLYFQSFDGAGQPSHMICRFGIRDSTVTSNDMSAFRYVARGKKPEIQTFRPIRLVASKSGKSDQFDIDGTTYKGKEPGREISELWIGLYVVKSGLKAANVKLRGRLSPEWLRRENVSLTVLNPEEPEKPEGPTPQDLEAANNIRRYQAGAVSYERLLSIVTDSTVDLSIREEAADALVAGEDKKIVKRAVTLLYSEDLEVRRLGKVIVKGLTKRSFGYDPKGDVERRSAAIQKIIKHIRKYPKVFGT
jgi:hypothetical protein